jgi:hypothetical protein
MKRIVSTMFTVCLVLGWGGIQKSEAGLTTYCREATDCPDLNTADCRRPVCDLDHPSAVMGKGVCVVDTSTCPPPPPSYIFGLCGGTSGIDPSTCIRANDAPACVQSKCTAPGIINHRGTCFQDLSECRGISAGVEDSGPGTVGEIQPTSATTEQGSSSVAQNTGTSVISDPVHPSVTPPSNDPVVPPTITPVPTTPSTVVDNTSDETSTPSAAGGCSLLR